MRISDWSSDVCSSDLLPSEAFDQRSSCWRGARTLFDEFHDGHVLKTDFLDLIQARVFRAVSLNLQPTHDGLGLAFGPPCTGPGWADHAQVGFAGRQPVNLGADKLSLAPYEDQGAMDDRDGRVSRPGLPIVIPSLLTLLIELTA